MKRLLVVFFILLSLILMFATQTFGVNSYIAQFDWLIPGGTDITNSRAGEVRFIDFTPQEIQTINNNDGAFLNVGFYNDVIPSRQWVVRNLYISSSSIVNVNDPGAIFGLGDSSINGTAWNNNYIDVMLTIAPTDYGSIISTRTFQAIVIGHEEYLVGGMNGGGSGNPELVNNLGPWIGFSVNGLNSPTPFPTLTTTPTLTPQPTQTSTPTPTQQATPTATRTSTPSPTGQVTPTPTRTPTPSPTQQVTPTPTQQATPTPTKTPTPTPTPSGWRVVRRGRIMVTPGPVNEGINNCAPGSVTRSIRYMAGIHGRQVDDSSTMFYFLVNYMLTDPVNGTFPSNMLNGKNEYTSINTLPIYSQIKNGMPINDVINTLNLSGDVEILISWYWYNGTWQRVGGHAAMITEVVQHADGSLTITYVDDPVQGNGLAENQYHTIYVDPNGIFYYGNGVYGKIDGFLIENWF